MKKSVGSFIAWNRNLIIVLAVILGVTASGFVAWQATATEVSGTKPKMSESERKEKRVQEANPSTYLPKTQTGATRPQDDIRGMYRGVQTATHFDVSAPLRTLTGSPAGKLSKFREFEERSTGNEGALGPQDIDKSVQSTIGIDGVSVMPTPIVSFDSGISCGGCQPPDPNGDVGPNHFVAMGNLQFQIFNKTGTSLLGPTNTNALWAGFGGACQNENQGDPVVLYDQLDDRWILTQFTADGPQFFNCVAVSTSPDPTGTYFRYAFTTGTNFPDYPKYGMWGDALYISTREFAGGSFAGVGAYAVNRAQLIAGNPAAQLISFLATPAGSGGAFNVGDGLVPTDLDGAQLPPVGSPNYFLGSTDQGGPYGAPSDALTVWKFTANFVTPASSSFVLANTVPIAVFDTVPAFCSGRSCVPQPGTTARIDHLGYRQRPLFRAAYRNFGSHESIVTNQSVEASATMSGIRWWEVRSPNSNPVIHQEGTYAPGITDGIHRWMGGIAMDTVGNIALGFSASAATGTFPSSWYTGRLFSDPLGTMPQGEASIVNGAASQTSGQRWGDYTDMVVDPVDDCTFWYTNEYIPAGGAWRMRVGSFKFPNCSLGPNFSLAVTPASQAVCAPANAVYTVNTTSISGFTDPVTLIATGNPAGTIVTFSPNPVTPGNSSTMTVSNTGAAAAGSYTINVLGTSGALTQNQNVTLNLASGTPAAPTLTSPANGSTAGSLSPTFTWAAVPGAATYEIQVATDAGFTNVVASATGLTVTSFTPASPLASNTPYFWRVRAVNACATGAYSTVFSFTTPCVSGYVPTTQTGQTIPAGGTFVPLSDDDDFVVAIPLPSGWTSSVYGLAVTSLSASTNGHMTVNGAAVTAFTNTALPAAIGGTNPTLLPYWDDLDMDVEDVTGGGIFTNTIGTAPNRQFYVEWRAQHFSEATNGPITINIAILLTEGSDVVRYIYASTGIGANLNGATATVGIQRQATGTNFSQFSFNTASLSAGLQITYATPGCGTPTATATGSPATATATNTGTATNTATATPTGSPCGGTPLTFAADAGSLGPIVDNNPASPRNVTFTVSGVPAGAPADVQVDFTMNPIHTWVGDIDVTLIAPDSTQFVIFASTGATTPTGVGDSSDLSGAYVFTDSAAGTNWWAAAATAGAAVVLPPGNYRTTQAGPQTAANFSPPTNLTAAFAAVSNPNGTWTMRFTDNAAGDTGTVSAANLRLTGTGSCGTPTATFTGTPATSTATNTPTNTNTATATPTASPSCTPGSGQPGPWATGTTGPPLRYRGGATSDGTFVYIYGGGGSTAGALLNDLWRWNPATGAWTQLANMPTAKQNIQGAYFNGKIYVPGGFTSVHLTENAIYDIATNTWSTGAPLPATQTGTNVAFNGKVYVLGGNPGPVATTRIYDIATNTWATGASMPVATTYGRAVIAGNFAYYVGGIAGTTTAAVHRYNLLADTWTTMAPLQTARTSAEVMASPDGTQLFAVMGGDATFFTGVAQAQSVEIYNIATNTWTYGAPVVTKAAAPSGGLAGGKLMVEGGVDNATYLNTVQVSTLQGGGSCGTPTSTSTGSPSPTSTATATPTASPCNPGYNPTTQTGQTIPAGGTFVPLSDDDDFVVAIPLPAGFASTVYGLPVTSLSASTNGHMTVNGAAVTAFTNTALPAAIGGTNPTLLPYWDDLDMDVEDVTGGGIFTNTIGTAPNRQFYVEWRAQHFSEATNGPITINFAILLTEGSDVVRYIYASTGIGANLNGATATVGIQRQATGTNFSQFSFDTASLSAGLQITYTATGCGTPTATATGSPATATATNTATATPTASPSCTPGGGSTLTEGFDNVTTLPAAGWFTQNNSVPVGTTGWSQGTTPFPAHTGGATSYITANFNNTTGTNTISNWLLTPALTLQNGASMTFWTRTVTGNTFPDRLQVRMSTAGASTNVGTGPTGLGDFTTLLLDINPTYQTGGVYPEVWTQFTVNITGVPAATQGRLAFRYFVEQGGPTGANSNYIGIDTFQYNGVGGGCPTATATATATATSTPGGATSVQFSSATYTEDESQTAVITINRTGNTTGTTTVNFATSNGTATGGAACGTSGVDYVSVAQAVTFNAGETSRTVNVEVCGDTLVEPTQTVNLTLTGASVGTPGAAVLSINDTANALRNGASICTTFGQMANPYPSTITVPSGPPVGSIRVTLYDVVHTSPDSMDFLLVGPTGQKFILMADAGGVVDLTTPVTLTFSDAALQVVPDSGPLTTGAFEPTSWIPNQTSFPAPAPPAPYNEPGSAVGGVGTQTLLGNFGGTNATGVWSLYMRDDAGALTNAITGCVNGGWGLEILGATAANASISGRVMTADGRGIRNANVVITGNSLTAPRVVTTGSFGYFSVDGLATGETYVVTVNSRRYTFGIPSRVISLVDNVVDADFIADPQE